MKKRDPIKTLKNKCESLWKEVCRLRDGEECQARHFYPHACTPVLQVDHCFSRMNSKIFFDIRNGTTLCKGFHTMKSYRVNGAEKAVDEFVKNREGLTWWEEATKIVRSKTPYKWNIIELEQLLISLQEKRADLLQTKP